MHFIPVKAHPEFLSGFALTEGAGIGFLPYRFSSYIFGDDRD